MARIGWVVVSVLGLCLGCGGAAPLDCAWLAGEKNCWKATAADATSCLPPTTETGVLSADNATCTYASGAQVKFTPALDLMADEMNQWNFTISNGGTECLHYEKTSTSIKLTVKGHTVTQTRSGALGINLTCPDGTSYAVANAFDLFSCGGEDGGASFDSIPGSASSYSDNSISFGLTGTSADSLALFDCQR